MKSLIVVGLLALSLALSGCAMMDSIPKNDRAKWLAVGGATAGALTGQMVGKDTEATLIGAAVGGLLGYIVGNEMDKGDRQRLNHTYEYGRSGEVTRWVNPDSGNQYQVTPQPAYTHERTQRLCRPAMITAVIDGKVEETFTTACRNKKTGQWELQ